MLKIKKWIAAPSRERNYLALIRSARYILSFKIKVSIVMYHLLTSWQW